MSVLRATVQTPNLRTAVDQFHRRIVSEIEAAALAATNRGRRQAVTHIRADAQRAGLGRLGNAIGSSSDQADGRGVHRRPDGFSASGSIFIRSGSPRTRGAIEAYTEGATITPVRGRWLWIATEEAGRTIGGGKNRKRLTPETYRQAGEPMGPLIRLKSVNGYPLLAVQAVGKSEAGARGGRVRPLTKHGRLRKGDRAKAVAVLFVGIPRTTRAVRIDPETVMQQIAAELPELFKQALGRK